MLSLYEILKASKTGIAPDMWTALAGANFGGAGSGAEVKELTGIPPLSFTANGQPLLDYLISGNMAQSGTPTQETPIQPQECGERTGNLCPVKSFNKTTDRYYAISFSQPLTAGTYTISAIITPSTGVTESRLSFRKSDASQNIATNITIQDGVSTVTVTLLSDCYSLYIYGSSSSAEIVSIAYDNLMIIAGSTAPSSYIPYGYKIPISSGGVTTPVYLGEVESTRKIKMLVLTGEENWKNLSYGSAYLDTITDYSRVEGNISKCSHFLTNDSVKTADDAGNGITFYNAATAYYRMYLKDTTTFTTIDSLKAYLQQQYAAGTPVTVWYVLATPTTGIVNEPLRKIGDYADTLSMEQAGVSIPTLNGQTVIDVDTTLKPSEMYIKYKG